MARNNSWCAPKINIRTYFVQHFHKSLLFINEADVFNLADDTTLYKCGRDLGLVSHKLEIHANIGVYWLKITRWLQTPESFNLKFWQEIEILKVQCLFPGKL